ncbi:hypothetical protein RCH07_000959 [Arthrobacter sp. CG_A4]|nr:hypothetical protein [Arthrobacter sp. CG_A4]
MVAHPGKAPLALAARHMAGRKIRQQKTHRPHPKRWWPAGLKIIGRQSRMERGAGMKCLLTYATGIYLVVVFFHTVRVLIRISRIVRLSGLTREAAWWPAF